MVAVVGVVIGITGNQDQMVALRLFLGGSGVG